MEVKSPQPGPVLECSVMNSGFLSCCTVQYYRGKEIGDTLLAFGAEQRPYNKLLGQNGLLWGRLLAAEDRCGSQ